MTFLYSNNTAEKKINNYFFVSMFCALAITVFLSAIHQYNNAGIFIGIFVVLISFIKPVCGLLTVIAFFTCDQFISGVSPDSISVGRYLVFVNIFTCIYPFIKNKGRAHKNIKNQYLFYYILVGLGIVSLVWVVNFERGYIYVIKIVTLVVWSRLAISLLADRKVLESLAFLMCFATFLVALVFVFGNVGRINIEDRVMLEGIGINSIATSFGFVIVFVGLFFVSNESRIKKIILFVFVIFIYIAILKMGTRSVALGIPLSFILGAFISSPKKVYKHAIKVIIIGIAAVSLLFFAVSYGIISDKLGDRFLGLADSGTYTENSRVSLAKESISYALFKNPLGTGVGNEALVFNKYKYKVDLYESHNTLISTLVQFGLFGFIILMTTLFRMFYHAVSLKNETYRFIFVVLIIFFISQLLKASILQTRLYWVPMTIILASLEFYYRSHFDKNKLDNR